MIVASPAVSRRPLGLASARSAAGSGAARDARLLRLRCSGVLLVAGVALYLCWLPANLDWGAPYLVVPFLLASLLTAALLVLTVVCNWNRATPPSRLLPVGAEEPVAVLVPTYNEPVEMVARTLESVLEQRYPRRHLVVVVGDDGHRPAVREMVSALGGRYPDATLVYLDPPAKADPRRKGEAKAGNLNHALAFVLAHHPTVEWIETRDADDAVGDPDFLRHCVGQLRGDPTAAYVQTIKDAHVGPGDPFGNRELLFYRQLMPAKHADNAVFPCGSGLVWRKAALLAIGGFPSWNLVEDLQSGVEALRRGWRGLYLPIVGAVGQIAPEDVPNAFKQRGTWCLDTLRLLLWGEQRGLGLRQRLHFWHMGLYYLHGVSLLAYAGVLLASLLLDLRLFRPDARGADAVVLGHWALIETFTLCLAGQVSYRLIFVLNRMPFWLAPVFARAAVRALVDGPRRKPLYQATRKHHRSGWHWRETLPHWGLLAAVGGAAVRHLAAAPAGGGVDAAAMLWVVYACLATGGLIALSGAGAAWPGRVARFLNGIGSGAAPRRLVAAAALALGLLVTESALSPFEPAGLTAGWTGPAAETPAPGAEASAPLVAVELVAPGSAGVVDDAGTGPSPVASGPAGVGIGIYTPAPLDTALEPILGFEGLVDHRMAYALWFQAWGDADAAFRPDLVAAAARHGLVPVITWEPWRRDFAAPTAAQPRYSLSSIADGDHDAYLRDWARQARAAGTPIVLRFAHEATTRPGEKLWYPWQGEPEEYRRAFRHVVGLFRAEGADDVRFMFSGMWLDEHADAYYPGDDVVDYVGSTVLNHGTAPDAPGARWRSFAELFDPQYRAARAWGKPVFLTEVASAEQGGDKARWLGDFLEALPRDYPSVVGILLLETRDREWPTIDWSVASGPESLAALRRAVADPYFR